MLLPTILLTSTEGVKEKAIMAFSMVIAITFFVWILFLLPANMARKRGRSKIGWILLFWCITPFWGIIALLILGDSKKKIYKDIMEELSKKEE